jgi:hypothetical protein
MSLAWSDKFQALEEIQLTRQTLQAIYYLELMPDFVWEEYIE